VHQLTKGDLKHVLSLKLPIPKHKLNEAAMLRYFIAIFTAIDVLVNF
jgi:hypothetical protein